MVLPFVLVWLLVALPVAHKISPVTVNAVPTSAGMQVDDAAKMGQAPIQDEVPHSAAFLFDRDNPVREEEYAQDSTSLTETVSRGDAPTSVLELQAVVLPVQVRGRWLAAKSELQYLRVWTQQGDAMVLGSLSQVEEFYADAGIRVHKSWWVAADAIAKVNTRSGYSSLTLSNALEVPVSRRKKQAVMQRLERC
jgi:DNA-binding LytR/AlgR family response regulator